MAEAARREQVSREEGEGGDVAEVGGEVRGFGGQVGQGCAGVDGGGEGEERREGDGGEGC